VDQDIRDVAIYSPVQELQRQSTLENFALAKCSFSASGAGCFLEHLTGGDKCR
jgi:hypothetical protein